MLLLLAREAGPDLRPATMPTTAPATLPAIDATPLAILLAPVTRALVADLPLGVFEVVSLELLAAFPGDLVAALAAGLAEAFDDFAEASGLAALDVFAALDASAALACFGGAFFPDAADFASFDRSAIAAPAPVLASRGFAAVGFFVEMVLLI